MKLYQTRDHVTLLAGTSPAITIPLEIVGIDTPKTFIANIAFMLAGQNDPCFTAMTAFGIRYVGWNLMREDPNRTRERMIYVDSPSGAAVHMSVVLADSTRIQRLVRSGLESLPPMYRFLMTGSCKVEVSPMPPDIMIGFV